MGAMVGGGCGSMLGGPVTILIVAGVVIGIAVLFMMKTKK